MFKQKLIPLMGATLLLVGCGKPPIEVKLEKVFANQVLSSDQFEAKIGRKYSFTIDYNSIQGLDSSEHGGRVFAGIMDKSQTGIEILDFINTNKDYEFTYNDKKLSLFTGEYENWIKAVSKEETAVEDTFIYSNVDAGSFKGYMISFCRKEPKNTDKISISFTCKVDETNVSAYFIQDLTL